jgi:hypothetical protein
MMNNPSPFLSRLRGCVIIVALMEETVRFPAYRQAGKVLEVLECGLLGMGNRCLWNVE